MNRRALLRMAAPGAGSLLAGCLDRGGSGGGDVSATPDDGNAATDDAAGGDDTGSSDGGGGDADDPTDTESAPADDTPGEEDNPGEDDTPKEDDAPTETDGSDDGSSGDAVVDRSFEVVSSECGQGAQRAAVGRGADRVDVDGSIRGRNGCYTAELARATYDDGADELEVEVRSIDGSEEGEACQECVVDVEYRARFEFEDGTPDEVHVWHDGEHVTTN